MPRYRMLLVEELVLSDSAEFTIEAETIGRAAALLIEARNASLDRDSNDVVLADGQTHRLDPNDIVRSRVFCVLVDEHGHDVGEVEPDFTREATSADAPRDPHCDLTP